MARVTYVKAAKQRYEIVPKLDAEGTQVTIAEKRSDGSVKTTKRGAEVVRRLTMPDLTKPLPNHHCDKCRVEIKVGDPYKWIEPKSGPYGGSKRYRCDSCPTWHVWEYSTSLSARTAEISFIFWEGQSDWESPEDVSDALNSAAESIRELANEKTESAENMESGFGHETSASEDLKATAQSLESWADELEQLDIPEFDHEIEEIENEEGNTVWKCSCEEEFFGTEGEGGDEMVVADKDAAETHVSEALDAWRDELTEALGLIDECPV
jgi:hypothetical protein